MQKLNHGIICVAFACLFTAVARAETETARIECVKSAGFLAPMDSPDHRKYAPDRTVEVLHLALDVTPDFKRRTVAGTAVWKFGCVKRFGGEKRGKGSRKTSTAERRELGLGSRRSARFSWRA